MSTTHWRGEMAPLTDKVTGNEDKSSKVSPYSVKIEFDGSEFYTRLTANHRDFHFRALSTADLRNQIKQTFKGAQLSFTYSRSAELANNPGSAAVLLGRGR
jgi:hypothetical protein